MGQFTEDPFHILGIASTASDKDIKKAYRALALQHHPDRCTSTDPVQREKATRDFATIAHAYEILTNSRLRKDYDASVVDSTDNVNTNNSNGKQTKTSTTTTPKKKRGFFNYEFSDPYEIWKRDFRDQFGFDYPGAEYDFVDYDTPIVDVDTETLEKNRKDLLEKNGICVDDKFSKKKDITNLKNNNNKKKSMFGGLFGSNKGKSKYNDENNQLVVHDGHTVPENQLITSTTNNSNEIGAAGESSQLPDSQQRQLTSISSSDLVVAKGRNNRPIKMEVETKKDGKVTTTITTITRPDGTTETIVMKTGVPKKKNNNTPQITNGTDKENLLLNSNTTSTVTTSCIKDDPNKNKNTTNQLAIIDDNTTNTSKSTSTTTNPSSALALVTTVNKPKKAYVNPLLKSNTALVVKK